jgi:hypothetical protein
MQKKLVVVVCTQLAAQMQFQDIPEIEKQRNTVIEM